MNVFFENGYNEFVHFDVDVMQINTGLCIIEIFVGAISQHAKDLVRVKMDLGIINLHCLQYFHAH